MNKPSGHRTQTEDHFEKLRQDKYRVGRLVYPSDIENDAGTGHYVMFYINQPSQSKFISKNKANKLNKGNIKERIRNANNANERKSAEAELDAIRNFESAKVDQVSFNNEKTEIRDGRKRIEDVVVLAMPKQTPVSYSNDWSGEELNVFESIVTDIADGNFSQFMNSLNRAKGDVNMSQSEGKGVFDYLTNQARNFAGSLSNFGEFAATSTLGGGASRAFGKLNLVRNPHLEFFYKGISARSFEFEFNFTPTSKQDLLNVDRIINTFKFHGHPEKHERTAGIFFKYPSEFNIVFYSRGKENKWLHKIGACALTDVNVNYASDTDGAKFVDFDGSGSAPTKYSLSLSFQELEVLTKDRIARGY